MSIKTRTKRWGNSIGIIIPKEAIKKMNIKPEEEITIEIEKKNNVLKEMFGKAKVKKSSKEMIEKFREKSESKWLK